MAANVRFCVRASLQSMPAMFTHSLQQARNQLGNFAGQPVIERQTYEGSHTGWTHAGLIYRDSNTAEPGLARTWSAIQ